jgi:hypothetical protein
MNEMEERYRRMRETLKLFLDCSSAPSFVSIICGVRWLCQEMGADRLFSPYLRLLLLGGYLSVTGQDHRIALKMAESPSDCQEALRHPDPVVRCVVLDVLHDLWLRPDQMKGIFQQVLLRERDRDVLTTALALIGHAFHGTRDREIGKLLARIVTDASWGEEYKRKTVYQTLLRVAGRPLEEVIQLSYPYLKASWPLDEVVDHSLLEEFLSA